MAYFESITAGRGGLDSFNQALNNQRYANLLMNETISNFSSNITRAGALYDEAKIREDALKYQRMQDFYNNKRKDEAFELEKKQAELNMDFAKRQQHMRESEHKQDTRMNEHRAKALELDNRLNEHHLKWLLEAIPNNKAIVATNNKANNTPITPIIPKKTTTKEKSQAVYSNPMLRF
ncbi:hypothetical protein [Helicobacter phage FrGC43A]|uniref:hypothetical protein n=1 Tax=Helicobacter pylori TaxID=210 RepID=UPI000983BA3E|nr:hypothetical protein [Helicobacter pylori]ANT42886.1 hypothetical protein [Helicobacter phage FrGC43A]PUD77601.1 hypothetical protein C2R64_01585 [Helicobacter pylori]WRG94659.1 hypothetical protein FNE14_03285 [Helicobacter pylori]